MIRLKSTLKNTTIINRDQLGANAANCYNTYGVKHFIPLLILLLYSVVGALLFSATEEKAASANRKDYASLLEQSRKSVVDEVRFNRFNASDACNELRVKIALLTHASTLIFTLARWPGAINPADLMVGRSAHESIKFFSEEAFFRIYEEISILNSNQSDYTLALDWFEKKLGVHSFANMTLDRNPWTFLGAMFYATTIYTTVGYGHLYPGTYIGQVCTVLYACVGVPMFLSVMNDLGKLLSKIVRAIWLRWLKLHSWIRKCTCFKRQPAAKSQKEDSIESDLVLDDETDSMSGVHLHYSYPVSLAVALFVCWMLFCSAIFTTWEDWNYSTALYFFFISLTTIGLGDIVPEYPDKMLMLFVLILIGMALISLCFNTIQMRIEFIFEQMIIEMEESYRIGNDDVTDSDISHGSETTTKSSSSEKSSIVSIVQPLPKHSAKKHIDSKIVTLPTVLGDNDAKRKSSVHKPAPKEKHNHSPKGVKSIFAISTPFIGVLLGPNQARRPMPPKAENHRMSVSQPPNPSHFMPDSFKNKMLFKMMGPQRQMNIEKKYQRKCRSRHIGVQTDGSGLERQSSLKSNASYLTATSDVRYSFMPVVTPVARSIASRRPSIRARYPAALIRDSDSFVSATNNSVTLESISENPADICPLRIATPADWFNEVIPSLSPLHYSDHSDPPSLSVSRDHSEITQATSSAFDRSTRTSGTFYPDQAEQPLHLASASRRPDFVHDRGGHVVEVRYVPYVPNVGDLTLSENISLVDTVPRHIFISIILSAILLWPCGVFFLFGLRCTRKECQICGYIEDRKFIDFYICFVLLLVLPFVTEVILIVLYSTDMI